jgi:hypothetical protein
MVSATMLEWNSGIEHPTRGVAVEMLQSQQIQSGALVFSAMLFLIWILPGVVCRKGKFPEDLPSRK